MHFVLLFWILFSINGLAMEDERILSALSHEGVCEYFNSPSGLARVAMMKNLAASKAGSKLYDEFVKMLADGVVYKGLRDGIYYEVQLSQANEEVKGSTRRGCLTMTFTLKKSGDIIGDPFFNLGCTDTKDQYNMIVDLTVSARLAFALNTTTAMENPAERTCALCKVPAKQRCSACKVTYYCSPEHQKEHWPIHRIRCKELKNSWTSVKNDLKNHPLNNALPTEVELAANSLRLAGIIGGDPEKMEALHHSFRKAMEQTDAPISASLLEKIYAASLIYKNTPCNAYAFSWIIRAGYDQEINDQTRQRLEQKLEIKLDEKDWLYELFTRNEMDPRKFIQQIHSVLEPQRKLEIFDPFDRDKAREIESLNYLLCTKNKDHACLTNMISIMRNGELMEKTINNIDALYQEYLRLKQSPPFDVNKLVEWLRQG